MKNPIYIETEPEISIPDEVHPFADGSKNFNPTKEINDFDELIEYYSQIFN